jgi:hypothetical protein
LLTEGSTRDELQPLTYQTQLMLNVSKHLLLLLVLSCSDAQKVPQALKENSLQHTLLLNDISSLFFIDIAITIPLASNPGS